MYLLRGLYDVEIYTYTWGQPHLPGSYATVFRKGSGERIPLVNTGKTVKEFLRKRIDGRRVLEVSKYQPRIVDITLASPKR